MFLRRRYEEGEVARGSSVLEVSRADLHTYRSGMSLGAPGLALGVNSDDDHARETGSINLEPVAPRRSHAHGGGITAATWRLSLPVDGLTGRYAKFRVGELGAVEAQQLRAVEPRSTNQYRPAVTRLGSGAPRRPSIAMTAAWASVQECHLADGYSCDIDQTKITS